MCSALLGFGLGFGLLFPSSLARVLELVMLYLEFGSGLGKSQSGDASLPARASGARARLLSREVVPGKGEEKQPSPAVPRKQLRDLPHYPT